jgi:AcrR family transcriptional regulator
LSGSDSTAGAAARGRGRPRSEARKQAILQAAFDLLGERGLEATSMDSVADLAGVSKATIYRWWDSKELLALDALYAHWDVAVPEPRHTGSLRAEMLALVRPWVRLASAGPSARIVIALLTKANSDAEFGRAYRSRFLEPRRDRARAMFVRAIGRGEIPAGTDVEVALDLIWGPLYHRLVQGHGPLNERVATRVVDMALDGILPRDPVPG